MRKELQTGATPQRVGGGYALVPRTMRYRPPNLNLMPWLDENSRDRTSRRVLTRRDEALLRACIGGDENGAKTAIKYGANIDCVDEVGQTPTIKASRHNNCKVLHNLIEKGADMNIQDENGWSALFWAAQSGSTGCVKELIRPTGEASRKKGGCDLNCRSNSQLRPHNVAVTLEIRSLLKNAPQRRLEAGEPTSYDDKLDEADDFEAELEMGSKQQLNSKKLSSRAVLRNKSHTRGVRKARRMLTSAWGYHSESLNERKEVASLNSSLSKVLAQRPHSAPAGASSADMRLSRKKEDFDAMIVISKEMVSEPKTEPMVYSALWKYQGRTPMISFGNWAEQEHGALARTEP